MIECFICLEKYKDSDYNDHISKCLLSKYNITCKTCSEFMLSFNNDHKCTTQLMDKIKINMYETFLTQKLGIKNFILEDVKEEKIDEKTEEKEIKKKKVTNKQKKEETKNRNEDIIKDNINTLIHEISLPITKKQSSQLKLERLKLMEKSSLNDYILFTDANLKKMEKMFNEQKPKQQKNNKKAILNTLTSIDSRLFEYEKYTDIELIGTDIENFKLMLQKKNTVLRPYTSNFDTLLNYGLVVCSLREAVSYYLTGNIIRLEDTISNPYKFYSLETITDDKRKWKLDSRLEIIGLEIRDIIQTYLINIFKKLYKNIFEDNDYRENYRESNIVFKQEGDNILNSLNIISKPINFIIYIQEIIPVYNPTKIDEFDLSFDDFIQREKFENYKYEKSNFSEIINLLFDNITSSQINEFKF
jgi:hypothetical protein